MGLDRDTVRSRVFWGLLTNQSADVLDRGGKERKALLGRYYHKVPDFESALDFIKYVQYIFYCIDYAAMVSSSSLRSLSISASRPS